MAEPSIWFGAGHFVGVALCSHELFEHSTIGMTEIYSRMLSDQLHLEVNRGKQKFGVMEICGGPIPKTSSRYYVTVIISKLRNNFLSAPLCFCQFEALW